MFNEDSSMLNATQNDDSHEKEQDALSSTETSRQNCTFYWRFLGTFMPRTFLSKFTVATVPRLTPNCSKLTSEQRRRVRSTMNGDGAEVLVTKFNLPIRRQDMWRLCQQDWLNDAIINFYVNLIEERSTQPNNNKIPSVYAMNSFFAMRLLQGGHDVVKRWTRRVDLYSKEIILVPAHVFDMHWSLVVIDMSQKSLKYYDSIGGSNLDLLLALAEYLRAESLDKRGQPFDMHDFVIGCERELPLQTNSVDCGVFCCAFAERAALRQPINFDAGQMKFLRHKMTLEILDGQLWC